MTGMDERLAKVAEVLHEAGSCQYEPVDICGELAKALAPLLDEFRAEDEARVRARVEAWLSTQVDSLRGQFHLVRVADLRAALAASGPDVGERDA